MDISRSFTRFSNGIAEAAGNAKTFVACLGLIVAWGVSGPVFHFSDTWQLIINTSTTIVTFLMVFLIQNTQNRDGAAIQAKLDELIRTSASAENRFIGIEKLTQEEVDAFRRWCEERANGADAAEQRVREAQQKARAAAEGAV